MSRFSWSRFSWSRLSRSRLSRQITPALSRSDAVLVFHWRGLRFKGQGAFSFRGRVPSAQIAKTADVEGRKPLDKGMKLVRQIVAICKYWHTFCSSHSGARSANRPRAAARMPVEDGFRWGLCPGQRDRVKDETLLNQAPLGSGPRNMPAAPDCATVCFPGPADLEIRLHSANIRKENRSRDDRKGFAGGCRWLTTKRCRRPVRAHVKR